MNIYPIFSIAVICDGRLYNRKIFSLVYHKSRIFSSIILSAGKLLFLSFSPHRRENGKTGLIQKAFLHQAGFERAGFFGTLSKAPLF